MRSLSIRVRGDLTILLAAFIWGVAFYFQKVAMLDIGPLLFLGMRGVVAALTLLPFAFLEQRRLQSDGTQGLRFPSAIMPFGLLGGLVFFVAAAIQQTGIVTATVTNTGFLTSLYVVVTPFLFWIVRRQRPGAATWLAVVIALIGVWALGGGSIAALNKGDILVACSSVFWASLIILSGEAGKKAQPLTYTCIQFLVVATLSLTAANVLETIQLQALMAAVWPILYVGVLSSAFTFGVMAIAMQTVSAPRASIILSMETVFAAMAGYVFLGERLASLGWIGALLILLAVTVVQTSGEANDE